MLLGEWEGGPESDLDLPEADSGNHSVVRGISCFLNNSLERQQRKYGPQPDCLGPNPLLPSCVTLGKFLNLSVPWIPHLQSGANDSNPLKGLWY